ncbi:MAG: LytTR family transcriptional regulator DNA-binding domain-containing protein [Sphingobacteriales bacterium]|nr:LytTR family transcriptional regulator DNA-binding domain-containing protein [Sphingobacteriales bacterium]OJW00162.1 MAG: hypothetical protein BGO52_03485 [Sphingobacteriales bacterium 44-61]
MQSFIFIHLNKRFVRINLTDIRYVLSVAHHVNIFTDHGELMPHLSLKQLEEQLPAQLFIRVNRGTLVSLDKIVSFTKDTVYLKEAKFSFTDKYKRAFDEKVTIVLHQDNCTVKTQ